MAVLENDLVVGPITPANGVSLISLDFFFEDEDDIEVYKTGSETPLTLTADYTVAGEGTSTGSITLVVAANGVDSYSVYLRLPLARATDLQLRGQFRSDPFNTEMDRLWQAMQGVRATINRALQITRTSETVAPVVVAPDAIIGFDANGDLVTGSSFAAIEEAEAEAIAAAESAAAAAVSEANAQTSANNAAAYDPTKHFTSVSAMLASIDNYTVYTAGDYVFGGIFRFVVKASGEASPHVTNAGGVKFHEAGPFSTKDRLKLHTVVNIGDGYSILAEGSSWQWDGTVPIDTHQADTGQLKYVAPDAAAVGAWVLDFTKEPLSAFDQIKMRLAVGRVDFIGIGDSNQIHNGFGWDHGLQYALDQKFEMYATGLISMNEGNASGSGTGYGYNFNASQPLIGAVSGAPAALDDYLDNGAGGPNPHFYAYLAAGAVGAGSNSGMIVNAVPDVLDHSAALDFELHYGTFASGAGDFEGSVRINQSPFSQLVTTGVISTNTGAETMQRAKMSIAADVGRTGVPLAVRWISNANGINAPFFGLWMRCSNPARLTGYSFHTLVYRGGQSKRTMAVDMQQLSDTTLTYYFGEARRLQGLVKTIVITINSGANDRNETLTSVGPNAVTDGDSAAAFVDNFEAIKVRIEEIWTAEGWDMSELYWLVYPTHPVSDPDDGEFISYRDAIDAHILDIPNAQMIDISLLTDEAEMLANSWYASGGADRNHLTQAGYEEIGVKIIDEMM